MALTLPPAVSFIARSGTGKTTLVTQLIGELKERGYKVGALKHDAHQFEIDHPGKDSYRFTESGADSMLISSRSKAVIRSRLPSTTRKISSVDRLAPTGALASVEVTGFMIPLREIDT